MRLIPARAGNFRQGQVYVKLGRSGELIVHHLNRRNPDGLWFDHVDAGFLSEGDLVAYGWYLIDPSKEPATPEPDEFWEKCYLAALTSLVSPSMPSEIAARLARIQADACVAQRKSLKGAM